MNVLMLMAGPSEAFSAHGYPKNLIEIEGEPMVEHVLRNIRQLSPISQRLIVCVSSDEQRLWHTSGVVKLIEPEAHVVEVAGVTSGAACTALLAAEFINNDEPLVIANGDQIIDADLKAIVEEFQRKDLGAGTIVFEATHPRWSYVKLGADGFVVEAAEKKPLSKLATAGFYYYKTGRSFVEAAFSMIMKDAHVGGRFYVCPTFNELILKQVKIGAFQIARENYHSLASPENVQSYSLSLVKGNRAEV